MIVKLPYADDQQALDLRGLRVRPLSPTAPASAGCPEDVVGSALDDPLKGPSLEELARHARTVTVIVPDATRKVGLPRLLPQVLDRTASAGVAADQTTILVACGTHPAIDEGSLRELVGPLPAGVRVIQHDAHADGALVEVGFLRPELPLRLHRAAAKADLLITVGAVRHHYFAGFGGGPKMVFPGVAGHEEIQANHALVMDGTEPGRVRVAAGCRPGRLDGNPVAEEIARAASLRPPEMALCVVTALDGSPAWAAAGPWQDAFHAAVEKVRSWFEVPSVEPFEIMVASAGGDPSDHTLIQAHKALDAACRFLQPGGELLFYAALRGGLGSKAMEPFVRDPRPEAILAALARKWVQYGHTALRLVLKTSSCRVRLVSDLDPTVAAGLGFEPLDDPETVLDRWRSERPRATVGVMASGAVYQRT